MHIRIGKTLNFTISLTYPYWKDLLRYEILYHALLDALDLFIPQCVRFGMVNLFFIQRNCKKLDKEGKLVWSQIASIFWSRNILGRNTQHNFRSGIENLSNSLLKVSSIHFQGFHLTSFALLIWVVSLRKTNPELSASSLSNLHIDTTHLALALFSRCVSFTYVVYITGRKIPKYKRISLAFIFNNLKIVCKHMALWTNKYALDQHFSNFNVRKIYWSILLKFRFWFHRSVMGAEILQF